MYSTLNVNHAVVTSSRANCWIFKCHNSIIIAKFSKVQLTICAYILFAITYKSYDVANIFHPGIETEHV